MKLSTILTITVALLTLGAAWTHATQYTFQPTSGRWAIPGNWYPTEGAPPNADDVAIVPAGKTCYLLAGDTEDAARIEVASSAVLKLEDVCTLTLHGHQTPSIVNGRLLFTHYTDTSDGCFASGHPGILHIAEDLTIQGNNGVIVGGCQDNARNDGLITGAEDAVLTLANNGGGVLTVTGMLEIQVALVNNAVVSAGFPGDPPDVLDQDGNYVLKLTDQPKSGSGVWGAFVGTLQVDAPIESDGCWWMKDIDAAKIVLNAPCVGEGAKVIFECGDVDANEDFCVNGDFFLGSGPISLCGPCLTIDVAAGKTFLLGGACVSP